jgi:hypothetical protein
MASVPGLGTTFNLPNFTGELFFLTPSDTPLTALIGGLTGGIRETTVDFEWQTTDNAAVSQPNIPQGADATFTSRDRANVHNVVQIHQEGFQLAYTKMAATGNVAGLSILGNQPVQDERAFQARLKLEKMSRDVEYTFLQGVYAKPADNTTGRRSRGLGAAITTNAVAASGAQLGRTHFQTLFRNMFHGTGGAIADVTTGAPFRNTVIMCNAYQKQRISEVYGYAPQSRNVGGLALNVVEFDIVGPTPIVLNRYMPAAEVYVLDLSVIAPHLLEIPGYGFFFMEPLAKAGAYEKWQFYGEIGLSYGPERWHGKITGLATAP